MGYPEEERGGTVGGRSRLSEEVEGRTRVFKCMSNREPSSKHRHGNTHAHTHAHSVSP